MSTWDEIDRYMLLSSDAHAGAPMAEYKRYLDAQWHDDFDTWLAGVTNPWVDVTDTRNFDSDDRIADMDAEGVTGEVLFPNTLPPFYDIAAHLSGVPRQRHEFERRWAGLRAHNRWLAEFCDREPERRRGLVQLLPNDVDAAIAEMRWAGRHRSIGGVMLPAVPPNHEVAPYYDERYEPLWSTAVELGFAIHQHAGSGGPDGTGQLVARSINFIDHELWTRQTLSHMIVGGVFERHPELKVVWTEMPGLRWAVEDLERLTRGLQWVRTPEREDPDQINFHQVFGSEVVDGLTLTPMEYFRRNCYIGASMLSPHDMQYAHVLGVDRIMFGHDGPHDEGTGGRLTEALRVNFHDFSVEECRQMFTSTAADVYHFDLDALVPIAERVGPPIDLVHTPLPTVPRAKGSAFWSPNELRDLLDHTGRAP